MKTTQNGEFESHTELEYKQNQINNLFFAHSIQKKVNKYPRCW